MSRCPSSVNIHHGIEWRVTIRSKPHLWALAIGRFGRMPLIVGCAAQDGRARVIQRVGIEATTSSLLVEVPNPIWDMDSTVILKRSHLFKNKQPSSWLSEKESILFWGCYIIFSDFIGLCPLRSQTELLRDFQDITTEQLKLCLETTLSLLVLHTPVDFFPSALGVLTALEPSE